VDLPRVLCAIDVDGLLKTVLEIKIPDVSAGAIGWNSGRADTDTPALNTPRLDAPHNAAGPHA
jgi:hypothetical protein